MPFEPLAISGVKPVCKRDCPDRSYDCHGKCEKYKTFREQCDEAMIERFKKAQLTREVNEAVSEAVKRLPGKRRY